MSTARSEPGALSGRIILITGAGGNLGAVAAKACAAEGAQVVLLDKAVDRLERLYDEIVASGYRQPALYPLDLEGATEKDYRELAETLEGEFGALHGILHSAAELGIPGPLADLDAASWQRVMHINLTAAHLLTRALLPLLSRGDDGVVVFTTDSSARSGRAYWGAYGIAKIALEGLAHMLADELEGAGKIRVNLFSPGPVRSAIRRRSHPGENPELSDAPETLAGRYVYLLGPASKGLTGQLIEGA
jgi:NAD(P)-dependent dehydrogenase (short-subunit alcohol dehydrogenase family)